MRLLRALKIDVAVVRARRLFRTDYASPSGPSMTRSTV
jgi:hypothetical protein